MVRGDSYTLRIGTRGSRLALAQTDWVANRLRAEVAGITVEVVAIETSGDLIKDVPLGPDLGSSFFTKEIEDALLGGRVDVAVHSCKDLSTQMPSGLTIAAIPPREDPRDVLVSRLGTLSELPAGSTVGTASPRRRGFLTLCRPDLVVSDLRGNVPTRLAAVSEGRVDAVVLAAAGLARLGMLDHVTEHLDVDVVLPAAAQGALALQIREIDERSAAMLSILDDPSSRATVEAERACLRRLEAGCQAPVGALAEVVGSTIMVQAAVLTPDRKVAASASGELEEAEAVGVRVAEDLLSTLGLGSLVDMAWAGPPPRGVRVP